MQPIHDVDVILLLAIAQASKRRPAGLVDILAAVDLLQGAPRVEDRLIEAFPRMAAQGLLLEVDECFTLTAEGLALMAGQRKKATTAEQFAAIKDKLALFIPTVEHTILLTAKQVYAAVREYRAARSGATSNLLLPKGALNERNYQRKNSWRKSAPAGRRKP